MKEMFLEIQENFHGLDEEVQGAEMGRYTSATRWSCWILSMSILKSFAC